MSSAESAVADALPLAASPGLVPRSARTPGRRTSEHSTWCETSGSWHHGTASEVITMRQPRTYLGLGMILALMLSACAAGPNELVDTGSDPAGFWLGLWQGFISPITFLISLFTSAVNIYEVQNNGNWYDFGFMVGVAAAFGGGVGGGSASAGRVRRRRRASGS